MGDTQSEMRREYAAMLRSVYAVTTTATAIRETLNRENYDGADRLVADITTSVDTLRWRIGRMKRAHVAMEDHARQEYLDFPLPERRLQTL